MIALVASLFLALFDVIEAERAYRAGRFEEALAQFQAALSEPGAPEGPLLYDMGNCAYRLGRHAEAVLYYRRAKLRLPRDPEVEFNLSLAERELGLKTPTSNSFGTTVLTPFDSFTSAELLALVCGLETVGLVGIVLLRRRRAAQSCMALFVLVALASAARLVQKQWFPGPSAGVVLANGIALRSEPRADLPPVAELHAGELVRIESLSDRWVQIAHAEARGWTERAGVGIVD